MYEFKLPDPGEGLAEAEIVAWRVAVGDTVAVNDILVEIETSKSIVELPSPWTGVVAQLLVDEGQVVPVGTPIVRIAEPGETPGTVSAPAGEPVVVTGEVQDAVAPSVTGPAPTGEATGSVVTSMTTEPEADDEPSLLVGYGAKDDSTGIARRPRRGEVAVRLPAEEVHESYDTAQPVSRRIDEPTTTGRTDAAPVGDGLPDPGEPNDVFDVPLPPLAQPAARRLARELGVELGTLTGSGPNGLITEDDVRGAVDSGRSQDRRIKLRGVRREMFASMTASTAVPQATAWVQSDVTGTMELVEALRKRREFAGLRLSPLLVIAKAACVALARHPELNSSWDEPAGELVLHGDVNLGIAAATPRGLVVPNIKRANTMNLLQLATALNEMVAMAREGRVRPSDMANGTFSITNVGVFGIDSGVPILNPSESAILCLGTITRRPWVVGTGDEERVVPRWVTTLSVTFDHRLADGEQASTFLGDVAAIVADPALALAF